MSQIAIKITSQSDANQLASLISSHDVRGIDPIYVWDGINAVPKARPFVVGATCLFWLYPTNVHYNQYCANAFPSTLENVPVEDYSTVNKLAEALQALR